MSTVFRVPFHCYIANNPATYKKYRQVAQKLEHFVRVSDVAVGLHNFLGQLAVIVILLDVSVQC